MHSTRRAVLAAAAATSMALTLAACSDTTDDAEDTGVTDGGTIEVEDNHGTVTVPVDATSVVATDNRVFQTLAAWDIELSAAAVALMAPDSAYREDSDIVDLGSHNEPNLEAVVAAQPDLIINGQRFSQYYDELADLAPDAAIVELDPREDQPFDDELRRQIEVLGTIFGEEDAAAELIADFDASIERVRAAYDPEQTVVGVITSGGEINYSAPVTGRGLGPVYEILGLTPALEVTEGTTGHEGDDISVEALADANPDWILVLDRDAPFAEDTGDEAYVPANELIADSEALQNVTAVENDSIVYMPQMTYLDEGIQTYTEFFNSVADAMEQS